MAITKTVDEIKAVLGQFVSNLSETDNLPNFDQSEYKYLVPLMGHELYNDIHTKYNADPQTLSADDIILAKKMRLIAVAYAYHDGLITGHLTLTDTGARKLNANGSDSLYRWEFEKLQSGLITLAMDGIEVLLNYLFEKKPALWTASDAYKQFNGLLIRTATEFNALYTLFQPARTFWALRPRIEDVQDLHFSEAIGYDLVKYLLENATPDSLKDGMRYLKKALAFFSIKEASLHYTVRFSDQGFTVLSGEGDKDNAENVGRVSATEALLKRQAEACEQSAQLFLEKAKDELAAFRASGNVAAFNTAYDKGPMVDHVTTSDRTSGNENRKGVFGL